MAGEWMNKLSKKALKKRITLYRILAVVCAVVFIVSLIIYLPAGDGLTWLFVSVTYLVLGINFVVLVQKIKKELKRRMDSN